MLKKEEQEILLLKKRLQEKIIIKPIRISTAIKIPTDGIDFAQKDDGLTIPDHRSFLID